MGERPRRLPEFTAIIGVGLFSITLIAFLRPPLLPSIGRDLDLDTFGLAVLTAAFATGRLIADIPAGSATDRYDLGRMMGLGAAMVAGGTALMAAASHQLMLIAASFVLGLGSSWTLAAGIAFFAAAPRSSRGASVSVFGGSLLAAQAIGPALAGVAALVYDWRVVLVGGAGAAIIVAAALGRARTTVGGDGPGTVDAAPVPVARHVLWTLYALPALQFSIGGAVIQTFVPVIGENRLGLTPAIVGGAIGLGGVLRLLSALVAGQVSDRIGRRAALIPGLALQTAGLAVWSVSQSLPAWWTTIALLTVGSVGVNVGSTMLADVSEGGPLGRRLGVFRLTGDAAFLVGPLVAGFVFERVGPGAAVVPLLIPCAIVTAAAFWLPETRT